MECFQYWAGKPSNRTWLRGSGVAMPMPLQLIPHFTSIKPASTTTMGVPIILEKEHGYLLFVVVVLFIVNAWAGVKVGKARKLYDVPYPEMYAEKTNKNAKAFNCVQRAHQNMLENMPLFLVLLFTSAIFRPQAAAIFGLIRVLGFAVYVQSYASGDPTKRFRGAFGYIGLLGSLYLTIEAALTLLALL